MASVDWNADGSAILKLDQPIKLKGDTVDRLTLPRLTGKHMMHMPNLTSETPMGVLIAWAAKVVMPAGAVEELSPGDALSVAHAMVDALGKSQAGGAPASP